MPKPFVTDIQVRFGDTDMLGHINNAAYVQYLEVARLKLIEESQRQGYPRLSFVLAHISLDFRREIKLGQQVQVETWITRVGNSSFEMAYHILADGVVCTTARSIQVSIDPTKMASAPLPAAVRPFLMALLHTPQEEI